MKNRIELAEHFRDLGFQKGAEIGVCDGRYSKILMDTIPGLQLWGIDPYLAYSAGYTARSRDNMDKAKKTADGLLNAYEGYHLVVCESLEAAKLMPDGYLDFVFIDGMHNYESVKADIKAWYPKVRAGGILSGHDYYEGKSGRMGVVKAVNEFIQETGLELHTTEWDYDAHRDDQQPDWYVQIPLFKGKYANKILDAAMNLV